MTGDNYLISISVISGTCIDIHSHIVSQGLHYVPGPNSCTLCICDKGNPKWCKSVLCSPPQVYYTLGNYRRNNHSVSIPGLHFFSNGHFVL